MPPGLFPSFGNPTASQRLPSKRFVRTMTGARRASAFSLVELLTVISIIMVMASMSVPAISGISKGRALSAAVDRAWSAASNARQAAISTRTPVALVMTNNRQSGDAEKSDAFISMKAEAAEDENGTVSWKWVPAGAWQKTPRGVRILDRVGESDPHSFFEFTAQPPGSSYSQLGAAMPVFEGDVIGDFFFVVFRPDGTVDSPSKIPYVEFMRLRAGVDTADSALVLNRDTGRTRMVRYN